jgi:hypothetical protein
MRDSPYPDHVTVAQAAEMLGVSRQRVHILIKDGALDSVRRHRHVYVSIASVEARNSPTPAETALLTSTDVGRVLGKTVKQVNKIVEIGALHPIRGPRGRLLFDPREVAAYEPRPAHRPRKEPS